MEDEYLIRRFSNRNLLVIGSPAVNLAARRLSSDAVFHFDLNNDARQIDSSLRSLTELQDPTHLFAAWKMLENLQVLSGRNFATESLGGSDEIKRLLSAVLRKRGNLVTSARERHRGW
jgi:hypothetical protein